MAYDNPIEQYRDFKDNQSAKEKRSKSQGNMFYVGFNTTRKSEKQETFFKELNKNRWVGSKYAVNDKRSE